MTWGELKHHAKMMGVTDTTEVRIDTRAIVNVVHHPEDDLQLVSWQSRGHNPYDAGYVRRKK